jgi:hypothetical protein
MSDYKVDAALNSIKDVARQVRQCPACHSHRIYTAINVAYVFDHHHNRMDAVSTIDLSEQSWHGCFECDHQWLSGPMLISALPTQPPPARPSNVIDFNKARRER